MDSIVTNPELRYQEGREVTTRRQLKILEAFGPWRTYILALILSDVLMAGAGFRVAYFLRFELHLPVFRLDVVPSIAYYRGLVTLLIPVVLIVFALGGLYRRGILLGGPQEYSMVFRGTTTSILVVVVAGFIQPELVIARAWLVLAWGFVFFLVSSGRFVLRRVVYYLRGLGYFLAPAVIIGANAEGLSLAEQLIQWTTSGLNIVGFIGNGQERREHVGEVPILGKLDDLGTIIEKHHVQEVIIASSAVTREEMLVIFERFGLSSTVNLRMSSGLFEIITTGLNVKEFAYVPLVEVNKVRMTGTDRVLKTTLDYAITIPGLILISPLLLILAIIVKVTSPGPVIFRRRVMGVNGRQFDAFKFRTMHTDGHDMISGDPELREKLAANHKLKHDPRVTWVGQFLRKFSLDELPQLFNVLRHEMSLVGPRMISPEEIEKYSQWGLNLLTVQPGITGLWQVSGRSDISYEERVRLDMHYIRNWTIWMDLQLLWQTIPAVIFGRGAY